MKNPGFQRQLIWLSPAALLAAASLVLAQPPEASPTKRAVARSKPQVIYHLPPSSDYAARLHSQAKGQGNDLPIDSDMPASLQMSRANANAAAAKARQEPAPKPPQVQRPQPRHHTAKRPKTQSVRAAKPPSIKAKGPGRGGPHKSHKK